MLNLRLCLGALAMISSACVVGVTDLQEVRAPTSATTYSGYSSTAGGEVRILALNQSTQQWVIVARARATSTPSLAAGVWGGNPDLYYWSVSAPLTTPADPAGNCFFSPTCAAPTGDYQATMARLRFEEGSEASPFRLVVFDEYWNTCMDQQIAKGQAFTSAALNCQAPSFPELRVRRFHEWWRLPTLNNAGAPAIGGGTGLISVAATENGVLRASSSATMGQFTSWSTIPGGPPTGFVSGSPIMVSDPDGIHVHLLARGNDGVIYRSIRSGFTFGPLTALANATGATGRLAAVLLNDNGTARLHVVYGVAGGLTSYRQYLGDAAVTSNSFVGTEATVGGDLDRISIALRTSASNLVFWSLSAASNWSATSIASYSGNLIEHTSDVISFGRIHHLLVARRPAAGSAEIVDLALPTAPGLIGSRIVGYYGAGAPQVALAIGRHHLVAAWRDATEGLQSARLDSADVAAVWVRSPAAVGSTVLLFGRPALAAANLRPAVSTPNYAMNAYGDDLYGAALGNDGRVRMINLSRGIMRREVAKHFDLFDLTTPAGCSVYPETPDATWVPDLMANDRPIISEIGAVWWMLPGWFVDEIYRKAGQRMCEVGASQPATGARACELTKTPVVLKPSGGMYVCPDGAYLNQDTPQFTVFEELGHVMAGTIGFHDGGPQPTAADADVSDIPLADLQLGRSLFDADHGPCGDAPRRPGFTRCYDAGSTQHSFLYALLYYVFEGPLMRQMIAEDLARPTCNDLLARKYLWLRRVIFRGVEHDARRQPLLTPSVINTCPN